MRIWSIYNKSSDDREMYKSRGVLAFYGNEQTNARLLKLSKGDVVLLRESGRMFPGRVQDSPVMGNCNLGNSASGIPFGSMVRVAWMNEINIPVSGAYFDLFREIIGEDKERVINYLGIEDSDDIPPKNIRDIIKCSTYTRNVILYGPPGTGKTHAIQAFKEHFLRVPQPVAESVPELAKLPRWEAIALTLYALQPDESLSVTEMLGEQPLARYEALRGTRNPYESVMKTLNEPVLFQRRKDYPSEKARRLVFRQPMAGSFKPNQGIRLFAKMPDNSWKLTIAGRSIAKQTKARKNLTDWSADPEARYEFVTFHPSFAYEEFVEGLRPELENGQLVYKTHEGVFRRICRMAELEQIQAKAQGREPRPFLLVIDEINRANIAKVFGELMTLIEDDKRVTADGKGIRVTLPYSRTGERFGVPKNLHIIGTMNTADRSIALLDLALRRRFTFLEVLPDANVIRQTTGHDGVVDGIDAAALLEKVNAQLRVMLDRDHQMGHSYLTDIQGGLDELQFRWYRRIVPLLQEYFYNDGDQLQQLLGKDFIKLDARAAGNTGRRGYEVVELEGKDFQQALQELIGLAQVTQPQESNPGEDAQDG